MVWEATRRHAGVGSLANAFRRSRYRAFWLSALLFLLHGAAISNAQGLKDRTEDLFGDGNSFTVYLGNPLSVPVRITSVEVYACVETGLGCGPGSGASGIIIYPGREESVAHVTRAGCTNPVDEYGQVIRDDCSRRARTSFQLNYRFQPLGGTARPEPQPTIPSGNNSQSSQHRADQERVDRERQALERQQEAERLERQRIERQRAEQQRAEQERKRAEQERAERQRQLDRTREEAQQQEALRREQAERLAQQRAERQREVDQQRAQLQQQQEELRRQQEQRQHEYDARVRAIQDRVRQINENNARAQAALNNAFDQARAMIERNRIEREQREAQREIERLEQEAEQQRQEARRQQQEFEERVRRENEEMERQLRAFERDARDRADSIADNAPPGSTSKPTDPPVFNSFSDIFKESPAPPRVASPKDFASLFGGRTSPSASGTPSIAADLFDAPGMKKPAETLSSDAAEWIMLRYRRFAGNADHVKSSKADQVVRIEDLLGVAPGELPANFAKEKSVWDLVAARVSPPAAQQQAPATGEKKPADSFRDLFNSRN
jgi:hypothetical protein